MKPFFGALLAVILASEAGAHATILHSSVELASGGTATVAPANALRVLLIVQAEISGLVNCLPGDTYDDDSAGVVNLEATPLLIQVPDSASALVCWNRSTESAVSIDWTEIVAPAP